MGLNVRYCYTSWATARGVGQPEERTISILQALCGLMPRIKELFVMLLIWKSLSTPRLCTSLGHINQSVCEGGKVIYHWSTWPMTDHLPGIQPDVEFTTYKRTWWSAVPRCIWLQYMANINLMLTATKMWESTIKLWTTGKFYGAYMDTHGHVSSASFKATLARQFFSYRTITDLFSSETCFVFYCNVILYVKL